MTSITIRQGALSVFAPLRLDAVCHHQVVMKKEFAYLLTKLYRDFLNLQCAARDKKPALFGPASTDMRHMPG